MKSVKAIFAGIILSALIFGAWHSFVKPEKINYTNLQTLDPITRSKNIFSYFLKVKHKPKRIIFGYLPYWSIDKIQYLQTEKLTDIAYFGLHIKEDGSFVTTDEEEKPNPAYDAWRNNKDLSDFIKYAQKSGIRISLTVVSHNDEISDKFLDCTECWTVLAENIKKELDHHSIVDVNMNFEYVEFPDEEKTKLYSQLVDFINLELDKTYSNSYVTVATFADSFVNPRVTNVEELGKIADGLFIMAYDFHNPNSDNAGPVAPVDGIGVYSNYDLTTMINDYLRVVPPSKILLGVPYYGYNWVVEKDEEYAKRIPNDEDDEGEDEKDKSMSQAYSDVMDLIVEIKPDLKWDELAKVPYFTYVSPETGALREVYFENEDSLKAKFEIVEKHDLAGVGIWALGYDGGYQELWNLLGDKFLN